MQIFFANCICNGKTRSFYYLIVSVMKYEYYKLEDSTICIPIVENYKDCISLVKSDEYRWTGKKTPFISIFLKTFKPFHHSFLFWFRMSSYKGIFFPLCKFMYQRLSCKYNIDIPLETKIGYGFYIGHGICMVVNGGTIIGNNVNVSQFLNIGTNHSTPAIIGDNVYIGPQTCLVENVKIGNNITIGAGCVVTKSIPEDSTAAGVPAKVLNFNNPARYIANRYNVKE